MKKHDFIQSMLEEAKDITPPELSEELKSYPITVIPVEIRPVKKKKRKPIQAILLMMILFLGMGMFYTIYSKEETMVTIDINPSIEFRLNIYDRVIGVNAYNESGEAFIEELDVVGCTIDEALFETIVLAHKRGYLTDDKIHSILFSVKSIHEGKEYQFANMINNTFIKKHENITPFNIVPTPEDEVIAKRFHVSPAKVAFIRTLHEAKYGKPKENSEIPVSMYNNSITELMEYYETEENVA